MTALQTFVRRYPVVIYFALTFAISWGGVLLVIGGPGAIPSTSEQTEPLLPLALLAMFVGPAIAGLLMTALVYGRSGLRALLSSMLRWRVGVQWYAVALLTSPLVVLATLFALSFVAADYLPAFFTQEDKASVLLTGIVAGLVVGLFEELGWTGFAVPALRRRYGLLTTGLVVGGLWALWHFLVYFWGSADDTGAFSLAVVLPELVFIVAVLPVYRVLMVWVYDHTDSLLLVTLMHGVHTAGTAFILAPVATGAPRILYYLVLAAVLWLAVAAIAVANGGQLAQQPLSRGLRTAGR